MVRFRLTFILALLAAGTLLSAFMFLADQLKGNGNVITKDRAVSSFNQLEIDGVFNVYLSQGDKEAVKVETDENLQEVVETIQEGNALRIKWKKGISVKHSTKMNVYVTIKDINKLESEGVGNIESSSPLTLSDLSLKVSGVGNTCLELNCKKLNADVTAVGNLQLKGNADEAEVNASGTGNVKAFGFHAKKLSADVSGVGNADLCADEEISITASGIGNVHYTGNAVIKRMSTSGIGKVKKV